MPIQITTDLIKVNPAYNDSIISYSSSTLTGVTYSEITIGTSTFKVYPIANVFSYNFKEVAKVLINQNNFTDTIIPNLSTKYIYDDSTLALSISPTIKIYNTTTAETLTTNYNFLKNVEQLIEYKEKSEINKDVRILLPTKNYSEYYLNYWEGYPNDFSIYGLLSGDTFYFRNVTTLNQSTTFTSNNSDVKRVFFSDGGSNEYTTELLNLSSTTNLVEIWANSSFIANIKIKRIESKCGVYLKWFNPNGGYSYWLFDEILTDTLSTKIIDEVNSTYGNLQSITNTGNITGKNGNLTYKLTTNFNEIEKEHLTSILLSPMVEMYVYKTPFNQTDTAKFIGVKVNDGSSTFNNKYSNYKMDITITLPDLFTQTL
jgi:hypothetical protein